MICYQTDLEGLLITALEPPPNPAAQARGATGREAYLLPAGATWEPPPTAEGQRPRLVDGRWTLEPEPEPEPIPEPEPPQAPEPKPDWGQFFRALGMAWREPMDAIAGRSPHLHALLLQSWQRRSTAEDAETGRQLWNSLLSEAQYNEIGSAIRAALSVDPSLVAAVSEAIADYSIPWHILPNYTLTLEEP